MLNLEFLEFSEEEILWNPENKLISERWKNHYVSYNEERLKLDLLITLKWIFINCGKYRHLANK